MDKEEKKRLRIEARKQREDKEAAQQERDERRNITVFFVTVGLFITSIVLLIIETIRQQSSTISLKNPIGTIAMICMIGFLVLMIGFGKYVIGGLIHLLFKISLRKGAKPKNTEEAQKWAKMWQLLEDKKIDDPIKHLLEYDNEVCESGHEQYFDTFIDGKTDEERAEIFAILKGYLSEELYENLRSAYEAYLDAVRFDKDMSDIFEKYDQFYYDDDLTNETVHKQMVAFASTMELEQTGDQ